MKQATLVSVDADSMTATLSCGHAVSWVRGFHAYICDQCPPEPCVVCSAPSVSYQGFGVFVCKEHEGESLSRLLAIKRGP